MVAFLAGVTILRDVVGIKELAGSECGKMAPIVRDVFQAITGADAASHPKFTAKESHRK
jgi:hypothetical protein